jgi:hypothetical protein
MQCPRSIVFAVALVLSFVSGAGAQRNSLSAPIAVYSHDPSSNPASAAPVDEKQAMRDLDELVRLKAAGFRTEFDLMETSWFAPASGYRALRADNWPNGPDAWLARCRAAGIRPGIEIEGNMIQSQSSAPQIPAGWQDSMGEDGRNFSLFEGGYLPGLMAALQLWYDRGVRLFAFDSVNLFTATPTNARTFSPAEIASRNAAALRKAVQEFQDQNRDAVVLVTFAPGRSHQHLPSRSAAIAGSGDAVGHVDVDKVGSFTFISTGSPKPTNDSQSNLWRALDIEGDQSVRRLEQSGLSLAQIESSGFTATSNDGAGMRAWKGAYLLSMARGGWADSLHGDLSLIQKNDARWMSRVQRVFLALQEQGHMRSFGAPAGSDQAYGFTGFNAHGSVFVVVNPGSNATTVTLPLLGSESSGASTGRLQFSDAGFTPVLRGNSITLGPGQMAMVGFGSYAASSYDLGRQEDVVIPHNVEPVDADFHSTEPGAFEASFNPPIDGVVRVILRPRFSRGDMLPFLRADAGGSQLFTLDASQYGRPVPVRLEDDGKVEREMGWSVAEIDVNDLTPGVPLILRIQSNDKDLASLDASTYAVQY